MQTTANQTTPKKRINFNLIAGSVIIVLMLGTALAAPALAPTDNENPYEVPRDGFSSIPNPPSEEHRLGTMARQYDTYYGIIWGTRLAFIFGLTVTLGRVIIGVLLGLISGFYGKWLDSMISRVTDAFLSIPIIAIIMVILSLSRIMARPFGAEEVSGFSIANLSTQQLIIIGFIAFGWMQYARLIRANVLAERAKEYIQSAGTIGASNLRILFRHILPNSTQGLYSLIASDIGAVVVLISILDFLGLTITPNTDLTANWGQMLSISRDWIVADPLGYWYVYIPATAAIVLFSIGWSLIGDGLRDRFDPLSNYN